MEQVNKDRVIAVAVNTFFKYFVTGIIEADNTIPLDQRFEPAYLKRLMLEHYEQVSVAFNREAFFTFARMNYEDDQLEQEIRAFASSSTDAMALMRFACRTQEFYDTMVSEYKRNFELLLCGALETAEEQAEHYTQSPALGTIGVERADLLLSSLAQHAYEAAANQRQKKKKKT